MLARQVNNLDDLAADARAESRSAEEERGQTRHDAGDVDLDDPRWADAQDRVQDADVDAQSAWSRAAAAQEAADDLAGGVSRPRTEYTEAEVNETDQHLRRAAPGYVRAEEAAAKSIGKTSRRQRGRGRRRDKNQELNR